MHALAVIVVLIVFVLVLAANSYLRGVPWFSTSSRSGNDSRSIRQSPEPSNARLRLSRWWPMWVVAGVIGVVAGAVLGLPLLFSGGSIYVPSGFFIAVGIRGALLRDKR